MFRYISINLSCLLYLIFNIFFCIQQNNDPDMETAKIKFVDHRRAFTMMSDIEKKSVYNLSKKLHEQLTSYCIQLPVLGYNSARYDVCLIRKHLFSQNGFDKKEKHFVIKKNSSYTCITTNTLKCLDASNYLAMGTSYDCFLKSYDSDVTKSYFPYEWLDEFSKLDETEMPSYDAFFSKLKNGNTLEFEYNSYLEKLCKNKGNVETTLQSLHLETPPKSGIENYLHLKETWRVNQWSSVRDLLEMYNNIDVFPFVTALLKMLSIYQDKQIDLFKNCVTVPSAARHLIFSSVDNNVKFALCDESQKDIHSLFKNNICGGPSIVMSRHQEQGVTQIRDNKITQKIVGYDANGLYGWCMLQEMPVGEFRVRRKENNFQLDIEPKWMGAKEWLEWESHESGIQIETAYNGKEHSVLTYKLDGFCKDTNTAFEFHGCWYHGCSCIETKNDKDKKLLSKRRERTQCRTNTLRSLGYTVIEVYECEWK